VAWCGLPRYLQWLDDSLQPSSRERALRTPGARHRELVRLRRSRRGASRCASHLIAAQDVHKLYAASCQSWRRAPHLELLPAWSRARSPSRRDADRHHGDRGPNAGTAGSLVVGWRSPGLRFGARHSRDRVNHTRRTCLGHARHASRRTCRWRSSCGQAHRSWSRCARSAVPLAGRHAGRRGGRGVRQGGQAARAGVSAGRCWTSLGLRPTETRSLSARCSTSLAATSPSRSRPPWAALNCTDATDCWSPTSRLLFDAVVETLVGKSMRALAKVGAKALRAGGVACNRAACALAAECERRGVRCAFPRRACAPTPRA
jgi:hypothetical protein